MERLGDRTASRQQHPVAERVLTGERSAEESAGLFRASSRRIATGHKGRAIRRVASPAI